jgi:hypothetical protein
LYLAKIKLVFENRNEDIIARRYKTPEKKYGDKCSELRPFSLLTHNNRFIINDESKQFFISLMPFIF